MHDSRRAVTAWAGAVCAGAAALAVYVQRIGWLFAVALAIAGLAFVILLVSGVPDLVGWLKQRRDARGTKRRRPGAAFTNGWRQTTDGIEAPGIMTTLQKSVGHPGYMSRPPGTQQPPAVRVGIMVACAPLGDEPTTSDLRDEFLNLLGRPPIWDLINRLTYVGTDLSWRSYASNGRINNGAVLTSDEKREDAPIVSALMNLSDGGARRWGQDPRCAEIMVIIEPRDEAGKPAVPGSLKEWHERLVLALEMAGAFAQFLSRDVGVQTYDDPPTQLGVSLEAGQSVGELIDAGEFTPVAGSPTSRSFVSYVIAERGGKPADRVALDMLRGWCDHALHIHGYEAELAKLRIP